MVNESCLRRQGTCQLSKMDHFRPPSIFVFRKPSPRLPWTIGSYDHLTWRAWVSLMPAGICVKHFEGFFFFLLTLSLWNGFKKLPAISPSSRGVPGGLFMPAILLGEFYKRGRNAPMRIKNSYRRTKSDTQAWTVLPLATHPCHQSLH